MSWLGSSPTLAPARPQTGLTAADIVYVPPVEGGLSRLLAVFSSHFPPVVGPVRSAREDDLELLRQFGRPAFAYSGAQPQLLSVVGKARTVDLYAGRVGGYFRDPRRVAPHNLYGRTSRLLAEAPGASRARDIGFRFGPAPAGGRATPSFSVSYPAASFTFRWSARDARWLASFGRRCCACGRGQPAGRGHRGHPGHQGANLAVPGSGCPAAIRGQRRQRYRRSAARRTGIPHPMGAS